MPYDSLAVWNNEEWGLRAATCYIAHISGGEKVIDIGELAVSHEVDIDLVH